MAIIFTSNNQNITTLRGGGQEVGGHGPNIGGRGGTTATHYSFWYKMCRTRSLYNSMTIK